MKVLVVSGSSGGHIFPALAFVDSLKSLGADLLLVLPQKSKDNKIFVESIEVKYIHSSNLSLKFNRKNVTAVFSLLLGAWESLKIIIKFKPDVLIGFGSLNTVAPVFWAWFFRIKTIIHEQNVIPGRANRLLAKLADKTAVSFSQTKNYLNISSRKIILTGNPLRKDLIRTDRKEALDFFKFKEGKFNLLITGGSQGSHRLNDICFEAVSTCKKRDQLQLVHICGIQDYAVLKEKYSSSNLACQLFDFFRPMQYAYSLADLIICRAGATTIAELQKFKIPAILIPYPFAYAHQSANAAILGDLGAALVINDEQLSAEGLRNKLDEFLENPAILAAMQKGYDLIQPLDASALLAKEILN